MNANITLSHEDGADHGMIEYGLLHNKDTIIESLNIGDIDVYYSGDEPLESQMIFSISGVPNKKMNRGEIEFFERSTKNYLSENANKEDDVEILAVEVTGQTLAGGGVEIDQDLGATEKLLIAKKKNGHDRLLADDTTDTEISTTITGMHRPPSPGLDFDVLVKDTINDEDSTFKDKLMEGIESGGDYFMSIEAIQSRAVSTQAPTVGPTEQSQKVEDKGLGVIANLAIIIAAAVLTFGLVLGAFILHKRREESKKFKLSDLDEMDNDDEDTMEGAREDMSSRHRNYTQEVVVDINGDSFTAIDDVPEEEPKSHKSNRGRKSKFRSSTGSK
jgi:hypothetical protein